MPKLKPGGRPSVADRWKMGRLSDEELAALPLRIDLVDVARAFGVSETMAYRMRRKNAEGETSRLCGVPLFRVGHSWCATRSELYRVLGTDGRRKDGAA